MQAAHGDRSCAKLLSFFTALCLFLSLVEYAIPKPVPFMRLGLANLPILLSLALFSRRDTLLLAALKVLFQALVTGSLFSYVFLFSAASSLASALTMLTLHALFSRKQLISAFGLSLSGAMASSLAQLFLARFLLFGPATRYLASLLLVNALVTGSLLGLFAARFMAKSRWYAGLLAVSGKASHEASAVRRVR